MIFGSLPNMFFEFFFRPILAVDLRSSTQVSYFINNERATFHEQFKNKGSKSDQVWRSVSRLFLTAEVGGNTFHTL